MREIHKFKKFWDIFLKSIQKAYSETFRVSVAKVQDITDLEHINILAVCVDKLSNLTLKEATYELGGTSNRLEPLKSLLDNLQDNKYTIFEQMTSVGDFFVFPVEENGKVYHTFLPADRVQEIEFKNSSSIETYAIMEYHTDSNKKQYMLLRHHKLDDNGTLTISYFIVDEDNNKVRLNKWKDKTNTTTQLKNANHIGYGRFKSPISTRGIITNKGVPLNFGCLEIERRIRETLNQLQVEFNNGTNKIFADERILEKDKIDNAWVINQGIFPIRPKSGTNGNSIEVFNPTLRFEQLHSKLQSDFALYENQIGVSHGILTQSETTANATATEIRRVNADTIGMINKLRNSIDSGIIDTLKADCIFLNIPFDIWDLVSDYTDPFANTTEEFNILAEMVAMGAKSKEHLVAWYDNISVDEARERLGNTNDK